MAALTGNSVGSSYLGLLKTSDNAAIDGTLKNMTDGAGNATPLSMANDYVQLQAPTIELIESTGGTNLMQISPTNVYFEGAVDFTNASVTGIGGGAPGLVSGGPADSMKSDASLTTNPASNLYAGSIALGDGATAGGQRAVVIGYGATSTDQSWLSGVTVIGERASATQEGATSIGAQSTANAFATAIGRNVSATGFWSFAGGYNASATGGNAIRLGNSGGPAGSESIFIGYNPIGGGNKSIAIGYTTKNVALHSIAIGTDSKAQGSWSPAVGYRAEANGEQSAAFGYDATATAQGTFAAADRAQATGTRAIAIGGQSTSALADAAVIGPGLTALWAAGTTVNQLAFANVANLNFADQAAAVTGGVPTGGLYHTDGTVKIVY